MQMKYININKYKFININVNYKYESYETLWFHSFKTFSCYSMSAALFRSFCVQDLPTGADSCMTGLSVDPASRNVVVGGCGDGTVRVFDKRLSPSDW